MQGLRIRLLFQPFFRQCSPDTEQTKRIAGVLGAAGADGRDQLVGELLTGDIHDDEVGVGALDLGLDGRQRSEEREVKEETGMTVTQAEYLFSLPNIYIYSGFPVHTLDMFFRCTVADTLHLKAMDDAAEVFFLPLKEIRPEDFGLASIRKGLQMFLTGIS